MSLLESGMLGRQEFEVVFLGAGSEPGQFPQDCRSGPIPLLRSGCGGPPTNLRDELLLQRAGEDDHEESPFASPMLR